MELLAPVGSKESLITALRAGANAVYLGVPGFNARAGAKKINLYDIEVMCDHAHAQGVKVYLAFNTLVKHREINEAVKSIARVARFNPDGLIVQDLGVAAIVRHSFPSIPLHASTQMAVHNRMGVDALADAGFARAVVARELSFAELKSVVRRAPIPVEVFVHGALCFCVSGMCLFSSSIGGLSGNRGRCTQPCRRLWDRGHEAGYFFSPRDLELAPFIPKLREIGVASLKIEGRMRSSEYVFKTVSAYRMLIDAPDSAFDAALAEARRILSADAARPKTTCLFAGRDPALFEPDRAQCLGTRIGAVATAAAGTLTVALDKGAVAPQEGDRLRVANPSTDTTVAFAVKTAVAAGASFAVPLARCGEFFAGNPVYKIVDAAFDQKNLERDIDALYDGYARRRGPGRSAPPVISQGYTALISSVWKEEKKGAPAAREALWVRCDTPAWLDVLPPADAQTRHVVYLTKDILHAAQDIPAYGAARLIVELPPFISQRDLEQYRRCIDGLIARGVRTWVLNNIAQTGFFTGDSCELVAGHFLYAWNAYAAAFLTARGVTRFITSWEDDFSNISALCGPGLAGRLIVYLYGQVPIVRSRMLPDDMQSAVVREHGQPAPASFRVARESELAVLLTEKPVCLFGARAKLEDCGIRTFGIDLNYLTPDRRTWQALYTAYLEARPIPGATAFNFKREVM